ncbi:hypothetical protein EVAR_49184_1 [Eumeta japonica]|uniref:Uncharacterized protein n=1 Tax=Eumeta variegata TaxID=151549 RepID=A0A4C1YH15_EUMVA|nr:hypothetical protein EVAR_49184_1 [Eumeta japonica]
MTSRGEEGITPSHAPSALLRAVRPRSCGKNELKTNHKYSEQDSDDKQQVDSAVDLCSRVQSSHLNMQELRGTLSALAIRLYAVTHDRTQSYHCAAE